MPKKPKKYRIPSWYTLLLLWVGKYRYTKNMWAQLSIVGVPLPRFSTLLNDILILLESNVPAEFLVNIYYQYQVKQAPIKMSRPTTNSYIQRFSPLFNMLNTHYPAYKEKKPILNAYLLIRQLLDDFKDIYQDRQLNILTIPNSDPEALTQIIKKIDKFLHNAHRDKKFPNHLISLVRFYFLILKFVHFSHSRLVVSS